MQVVENSISYDWNTHLNLSAYYGYVMGKRVVRSLFPDDDANYAFLEVTFKL